MNRLEQLLGLPESNGSSPEPQVVPKRSHGAASEELPDPSVKVIVPPPWRPFPVEVLPQACRRIVLGTAGNIGCDESFVALPLLSVLAGAIGNARTIRLKPGWDEPSILWTAIIGESGTRKTPAIDSVTRPLWKREQQAIRAHQKELAQHGELHHLYQEELAVWKREGESQAPPAFFDPLPVCRRALVSNVEAEALAPLLDENPRGLTLVRDELSGWLASFEAKKGKKANQATAWLAAFTGRTLLVERKGKKRPLLCVPRATLSLTGGIQPDVFRAALQRMGADSVGARLLISNPPRRARQWVPAKGAEELTAELGDLLAKLEGLAPERLAGSEEPDLFESIPGLEDLAGKGKRRTAFDEEPRALPLSPEALTEWIAFFTRHAEEHENLTGDLAAAWAKLEAYAARLALVVHVVRAVCGEADPEQVDAESMRAGIVLAEWFGNELLRFYALFADCEHAAARQKLVALIERRRGEITVRQLVQCDRRFRGNYVRAEIMLNELVQADLGDWVFHPGSGKKGRWVFRLKGAAVPQAEPPTLPPLPPEIFFERSFYENGAHNGEAPPEV